MTDEELYLFDTLGFLKVEDMIDKATTAKAFEATEKIVENCSHLYKDSGYGDKYPGAFLYDKVLERIPRSPKMLKYACELLNNMPRLTGGGLMINGASHTEHGFHGQKEINWYRVENAPGFYSSFETRSIFCDLFFIAVYFTDVEPGDGGLVVLPGSHKSTFVYPKKDSPRALDSLGAVNIPVKAGDAIIMPLRLLHAAFKWVPKDRDRRCIFYTFVPQDTYRGDMEEVATAREHGIELDEETVELMAMREKGLQPSFKKIVEQFVPAES